MAACTFHIEWFPWHQEPQQPQWPQQPQQPQWPQWPQQPLFIKKLEELDVFINPITKMTYPGLSMLNGSSKIHYFIDFWHSFCWRLWRPCMLVLTKSKGHKSIAILLGTCWKPWKFFEFIRTYSNIGYKLGHFDLDDPVLQYIIEDLLLKLKKTQYAIEE